MADQHAARLERPVVAAAGDRIGAGKDEVRAGVQHLEAKAAQGLRRAGAVFLNRPAVCVVISLLLERGYTGHTAHAVDVVGVRGIADGIEKLYNDNKFRLKLVYNCGKINYSNKLELKKLYDLFNK